MAIPTRLGPYQILAPLASGGMGEVYRAQDTRLGREVALKVLPSELSAHPERLQRFEREARAASALNHPHIVVVHDVGREEGIDYLVMELVEGQTLAERLARGPLALEEVLRWGEQICSALEACHRMGLVHRDLKPANIMLTRSGVKLVDFGLARAFDAEPPSSSSAPTAASPLTREGIVVGTLPYMAPEQLQGGPVDARCDIFALGAVLYEATTGRPAFAGDTTTAIATAILTTDPPPASTYAPRCPRSLDRLIQFCLEKNPERRFRSAHDVGLQLSAIGGGEAAPASRSRTRYWAAGVLVLASAAIAALVVGLSTRGRPAGPERAVRFQISPPSGGKFVSHVEGPLMAVSPDGSRIAFIASDSASSPRIWVRDLDRLEPRAIAGTEGANSLLWSPDGQSLGFFASGQLKRVDLTGTAPVTIVALAPGIGRIGTWGAREILFSSVQGEAIYRVSPDGGEAEVLLQPDSSRGEMRVSWPWFLPDGESFLYSSRIVDGPAQLRIKRPGEAPKDVAPIDSQTQYVEPGFIVYVKEGVLLAQRFDWRGGRVEGSPFALSPEVRYFLSTGWAAFATSVAGTLAYRSESDVRRLAWFDREGRELGTVGSPGEYLSVAISPDGKTVLFDRMRPGIGTFDVWSLDLERGIETSLTSSPHTEAGPRWLPDGSGFVYFATRGGVPQLVRRDLATEREDLLLPRPGFQEPLDVSPDGRTLLFSERNAAAFVLWTLSLDEARESAQLFPSPEEAASRPRQYDARFSRDGAWVAFISDESGRREAYVTSRNGGGLKQRVSSEGAATVRWGRGGREIVYLSNAGGLYTVPVAPGPALRLGSAKLLFQLPKESLWRYFEVTPDGERFLAIVTESSGDESPATVVLNWPSLVAR
jgi:Tol biopolymer transport system component